MIFDLFFIISKNTEKLSVNHLNCQHALIRLLTEHLLYDYIDQTQVSSNQLRRERRIALRRRFSAKRCFKRFFSPGFK